MMTMRIVLLFRDQTEGNQQVILKTQPFLSIYNN